MFCPNCGQENPENEAICQRCGNTLLAEKTEVELEKPEKVANGIIGAVLGSLIGGFCIALLYQLDMVASISGIVLAFCTLKGYELLAGKLSTKGVVISVILMMVIPFVAYLISSGMLIAQELQEMFPGMTATDGMQLLLDMAEVDEETRGALISDLVTLYLFTGAGIACYFFYRNRKKKKEKQ